MIVSYSQKFIFVKPRKVAGTTIELMLSPHLKHGDLATPIEPHEENLRSCKPGVSVGRIRRQNTVGFPLKLRDHSPLHKAYLVLGNEIKDYFVISACRNPWDRAVSQFFWSYRKKNILQKEFQFQKREFNRFTKRYGPKTWLDLFYGRKKQRRLNSSHLYSLNNKIVADFVIRYEHLEQDFLMLQKHLNLPLDSSIEGYNTKSTFRPKSSRAWQTFYDQDTIELVRHCCLDEIKCFNYTFEGIESSSCQNQSLPFL